MTETGPDGTAQSSDATEQTMVLRTGLGGALPPPIRFGHYLVFEDAGQLKRLRIGADGLTIGRSAACDICWPVAAVSRQHCRVELDGDTALVTDLGSTNGTFVGGKRIERRTRLRNGVQLGAGPLQLRYEQRDERAVEDEARLEKELARAMDYVRAILPEPLTAGPVQAEWWYVPSSALGGDAFGYQYLDAAHFAGFVIDVSGHGIEPAMHAVNVANTLRRRALPGVDFTDPGQVAAGLNSVFPMEEHDGLMLTLWYFVYHLQSRVLRFCAAGHHPSFLVTAGGAAPVPLWVRAPSIGMLPRANWQTGRADIPPGSRLYVFSDGAFEIVSGSGEPWVIDNLRDIMSAGAEGAGMEARRIYEAVRAAARPGPLDDDFSALVVHFA